jgi:hypothetical protein
MAGFSLLKRLIERRALVPLQDAFFDLPRDFIYHSLLLRLTLDFDIAAGGGHNGVLVDQNPWSFLSRIQVEGTGGDQAITLINARGYQLARLEHLTRGIEPARNPLAGAGVATTVGIACTILVPFALIGTNIPPEVARSTVLNPSQFSKLTLTVSPGDDHAFTVGGDRVNTFANVALDVYGVQVTNIKMAESKPLKQRTTFFLQDATAALVNDRSFSQPFPTGNRFRGIMVSTFDNVTAAGSYTGVDGVLGNIRFQLGPTLIKRYTTPLILAHENMAENGVVAAVNPAGLGVMSNNQNPVAGFYYFDQMPGGRFEGLLDARKLPSIGVPIDIKHDIVNAGARILEVVTQEIVG